MTLSKDSVLFVILNVNNNFTIYKVLKYLTKKIMLLRKLFDQIPCVILLKIHTKSFIIKLL